MIQTTSTASKVRSSVHQYEKTRNLRDAFRSNAGAIDLASIMVGVLVIGVIAGIIAAMVFAVIPWSQDEAAKNSLDAVQDAESVAYALGAESGASKYLNNTELVGADLIESSTKIKIVTDAEGTCYVGASLSSTGTTFYVTSRGPELVDLADTTWCADVPAPGGPVAGAPSDVQFVYARNNALTLFTQNETTPALLAEFDFMREGGSVPLVEGWSDTWTAPVSNAKLYINDEFVMDLNSGNGTYFDGIVFQQDYVNAPLSRLAFSFNSDALNTWSDQQKTDFMKNGRVDFDFDGKSYAVDVVDAGPYSTNE